jgi:hypothetical protein
MSDIRPSVTQGNTILLADYNNIQTKIATILGAGSGQSGYGQALASSQLAAGSVIDDTHWDNLRTDLLKARQHQTGVNEATNLTDVDVGQLIDDAVITPYETFATTVETNKFAIAANQQEQSASTGISTFRTFQTGPSSFQSSSRWNGTITGFIVYTFSSAAQARYFFNSGGILRFQGDAGINGSTPKNQTWWNMTSGVVRTVGAGGSISFYSLTDQYQRLASIGAAAGVYVENRYYIDAVCNTANNTNGGATTVTIRFIFEDNDIGDQTGTGPAEDEFVAQANIGGLSIRSIGNVIVDAPVITANPDRFGITYL